MVLVGVCFLALSSLLGVYLYALFYKSRDRISDHFSFTVILTAGQITSFVIAIPLYLIFPKDFSIICAVNLWIGVGIGALFDSVTRKQPIIAGFFNGGVAAVMGTMIGAIAFDPTLCGLPASSVSLQNTGLVVGVFGFLVLFITTLLVRFSFVNQ